MVCVAALLLVWIGIVQWRDKVTLRKYEAEMAQLQMNVDKKREELEMEEVEATATADVKA
jgi:hypothetical protein